MRIALFALATVLGLLCQEAKARDHCENQVTTSDMARCADLTAARATKELNDALQKVMRGLDKLEGTFSKDFPERPKLQLKATLVAAQGDWDRYRALTCGLESDLVVLGNPSRGDYPALAGIACGEKMTRTRIAELKALAENYGIPLDP
jgi:uncharacterized protein YecT (DUF1311 family)